jgi:AcrR family transcriptional regulator
MSPRQSDARQRVVAAAAQMLARHGLNATSIREMAKRADAPLGSTYHHFPGGKQQVVAEAVIFAGEHAGTGLSHHLRNGAVAGLCGFLAMWRETLVRSKFRLGCPVMAAAVEEPIDEIAEDALKASAKVFKSWEDRLVAALEAEGCERTAAGELATLIVASVEGAIVLCRARRSIVAFDRVARQLEGLVHAATGNGAKPP